MGKNSLDLSAIHDGLQDAIHPRVRHTCERLFENGHYKQAALEALIAIEKAIQEKTGDRAFGRRLIKKVIGGKVLQLSMPVDSMRQEDAKKYFDSVFGYYRNYLAHTNEPLSAIAGFRVLVVASDLLDLIHASRLSILQIGGAEGLVKTGRFLNVREVERLLEFINNYIITEDVWDGFWEDLAMSGFNYETQFVFLLEDCDLVEIQAELIDRDSEPYPEITPQLIETIKLTPLGRRILEGKI